MEKKTEHFIVNEILEWCEFFYRNSNRSILSNMPDENGRKLLSFYLRMIEINFKELHKYKEFFFELYPHKATGNEHYPSAIYMAHLYFEKNP